jgi:hypothetical protein
MPVEGNVRKELPSVLDVALLKKLWQKSIRSRIRTVRLQDIPLVKDPLEWLAFEWDLDQLLQRLRESVLKGRYRAAAPQVVRAAKSAGLTRPLAFLTLEDQLLYKPVAATAEAGLMMNTPTWTRPGRFDTRPDEESPAESGWFVSFLRRQGQIWRIGTSHEFVVETDICQLLPLCPSPWTPRSCESVLQS